MVGAWAGWLEYCDLQQEKRDKLAAAVNLWTHKELASAFANFRLNIMEQKAVRLSLLHWQHMNLSKVFQRWKEYKARRAGLFGTLIALACKWEQPLLEDAFASWRDFTAERQRIKVVFGSAACVLATRTVSFCINGCAMLVLTGVAFSASMLCELLQMHRAYAWTERCLLWHFKQGRAAAHCTCCLVCFEALASEGPKPCCPTFRHCTQLEVQQLTQGCMKAMLEVWSHITLTRAFNSWIVNAQELKAKRALQNRAMAFWSSRELAQVCYPMPPTHPVQQSCMTVPQAKQCLTPSSAHARQHLTDSYGSNNAFTHH